MNGNTRRKQFLVFLLASLFLAMLSAQEDESETHFKIQSIIYHPEGKIQASALNRYLRIDTTRIYDSQEELEAALEFIGQRLENSRFFEQISHSYTVIAHTEDGINLVEAEYSFKVSNSLLIFPSPSFDSNTGTKLSLILRDQNFMGLMRPLMFSIIGQLGTEDEPENTSKVTGGFNFFYDYPFSVGKTQNSWFNLFNFAWTLGDDSPSFDFRSGVNVGIPVGKRKSLLTFNFTQAMVHDFYYKKYDDAFYFVESGSVSLPLTVAHITNTTPLVYTPFIRTSYTWDTNGIDEANTKLNKTPRLSVGQTTSIMHIDWKGNFRNGDAFLTTQSISRDFHAKDTDKMIIPLFSINWRHYKSWKYAGIYTNFYFFATHNDSINVGNRLRGILDNQRYRSYNIDIDNYALATPSAFIANIDLPLHIITTDWQSWFHIEDTSSGFGKLLGYMDFELQLSPFVDIALIKNRATGRAYSFEEGLYSIGVEMLVYPKKWKSYVVRASLGFDMSKHRDWRSPRKDYELFVGIGHHF